MYVTSEVSLRRFYFALSDDGLTLKTWKMAYIGFCIQTLQILNGQVFKLVDLWQMQMKTCRIHFDICALQPSQDINEVNKEEPKPWIL